MEDDFNKKEKDWIGKIQKLLLDMPDGLKLYCEDTALIVCKKGIPSTILDIKIGYVNDSGIRIIDLHDAWDNGLE